MNGNNLDDHLRHGVIIENTFAGAKNVVIAGNLFSSLQPKALETRGASSRKVLFSNNLLIDVVTDETKLKDSFTQGNLKSND